MSARDSGSRCWVGSNVMSGFMKLSAGLEDQDIGYKGAKGQNHQIMFRQRSAIELI